MDLEGRLRVSWTILRDLPCPHAGTPHGLGVPVGSLGTLRMLATWARGGGTGVTIWDLHLPDSGCPWASHPSTPSPRKETGVELWGWGKCL